MSDINQDDPVEGKSPAGEQKSKTVGGSKRGSRILRRRDAVRRKRNRRRRRFITMVTVTSVVATLITVTGSIFFAAVDLPDELDDELDQNSVVYYSDGKTPMATIGTQKRTSVPLSKIPRQLRQAVIATEDKDFYEHEGVDIWGVMRALWNNVSGGKTQGASTLTQQYVGQVAQIRGDDSYLRKGREAAMAMKLEDRYTKDEILGHYLNLTYFGRGAYGVEAAAKAFFGKTVSRLNASQCALLAAQIKSPSGQYDPRDPLGLGQNEVERSATARWNYVLDQLVKSDGLSGKKRATYERLPETAGLHSTESGRDSDTGFISHSLVMKELKKSGITEEEAQRGGYRITTTIDRSMQAAAKEASQLAEDGDKDAAMVSIESKTGRVLTYYGGPDGTTADQAGDGMPHPPGSSFSAATTIAAMENDFGPESTWNAKSPREFDGVEESVENLNGVSKSKVRMSEAIAEKLNTPLCQIAKDVGPANVASVAERLGVGQLREPVSRDDPQTIDTTDEFADWQPDLGMGAYSMSVMDSASMYATIAEGGIHRQPQVIDKVTKADGDVVDLREPESRDAIDEKIAMHVTKMLAKSAQDAPYIAPMKKMARNGSATWQTGFTEEIALSVWAGDSEHEGDGSSPEGTLAQAVFDQLAMTGLSQGDEELIEGPPSVD